MNREHNQLIKIGRGVLQDAPQLYIDVDVEADGKPGYGSLLSIGAIAIGGEQFYIELKPDSELWVPNQRQFCEQHNLTRKRLMHEGQEANKAITKFYDWTHHQMQITDKAPVFSAFNAGFDFGFIDLYLLKAGLQNPYGVSPFDLKSATQGLSDTWDWRQTSKGNLPTALLPDGDFTHNALEDAIYQQKIHFALAGLTKVSQQAC